MQTRARRVSAIVLALALFIPLFAPVTQADSPPPLVDDALVPPPPPAQTSYTEPGFYQPSQFMAGAVSVRVLLLESDGSAEPSIADWNPPQIETVLAQIRTALTWWKERLPLAQLRFSLTAQIAPTGYEPAMHGVADEQQWLGDALARLGFAGETHFERAYAAANAHRLADGSDWATTIVLVNSAPNAHGRLSDGRFAYAYVGGPFLVLTSGNGPYGTERIAPVLAHELGHIFGALDQYSTARVPCDQRSGYLDAPTPNSQFGNCTLNETSIMRDMLAAYAAGAVDTGALAQLGYRDSDGDSIIDPLDTTPDLQLAADLATAEQGRPTISGTARDLPIDAPAQPAQTINHITRVEYRVDGGLWLPVIPTDGAYDSDDEPFRLTPPLYDGNYLLGLRAFNSAGNSSLLLSYPLAVSGVGAQPAYQVSGPATSDLPLVELSILAPTDTNALQVSEQADFREAAWQPLQPLLNFELAPGTNGLRNVYLRFRDANGRDSLPYTVQIALNAGPRTILLPLVAR